MPQTRTWDGSSYDRVSAPMEELGRGVLARLPLRGDELVLDPAFFHALGQADPRLGRVAVLLKRGRVHNELTKFRYDVLLQRAPRIAGADHEAARPKLGAARAVEQLDTGALRVPQLVARTQRRQDLVHQNGDVFHEVSASIH